MDEMTPPPMPMPVPTAMMKATSGNATLMPAKPASPTACPTNTPSMMLYTPPNVNVIIVGMMYFKYSFSMPLVIMIAPLRYLLRFFPHGTLNLKAA